MINRNYIAPGVAAVLLAVLFPVYWLPVFNIQEQSLLSAYRADVLSLTVTDLLFVVIGALEIYLYFSLRKIFAARLNGSMVSALLLVLMLLVALFHLTVLADIIYALGGALMSESAVDTLLLMTGVAGLLIAAVFEVVSIILAIVLLLPSVAAPVVLKLFAVFILICSVLQLTIVFAVVNIFLFPAALILLAIFFFREDHVVDVV